MIMKINCSHDHPCVIIILLQVLIQKLHNYIREVADRWGGYTYSVMMVTDA